MNTFMVTVLDSSEVTENCGTKVLMLARLEKMGIYIPAFYGIEVYDFLRFFQNVDSNLKKDKNYEFILSKKLPEGKYMVRSSVVPKGKENPDFGSMISGAFESYVAKNLVEVPEKILDVWQSFFSEKAKEQCDLFLEGGSMWGMGVLIQRYIEPVISGVLHSDMERYNINWIEGHLSKIVSGKDRGNTISCYRNESGEIILRGVEKDILEIVDHKFEPIFIELEQLGRKINRELGFEIEVEWLYDGAHIWVVQCQKLIGGLAL